MKITMIGTGYVGLVTGTCFAESGNDVICLDVDVRKVNLLKGGGVPIYEPGLEELVRRNAAAGRLKFTTDYAEAISSAQCIFICVGTPQDHSGAADLKYVQSAAEQMAPYLRDNAVVVCKSTVPVGTNRKVAGWISARTSTRFRIASNPEFLKEGAAIDDFTKPDRVVVGVDDPTAAELMQELYKPFLRTEKPFIVVGIESAEMIKYAANCMLATKISFINEISTLCEAVGADVHAVAKGMGMDKRIGGKFLHPGPGYGGSCFPKDTQALVRIAQENGVSSRIVEAVIEVNAAQKARMIKKIREALGGSEAGRTIGVLGLTFKPETDDMRDAPALSILPPLMEKGARIVAHDPQGQHEAETLLPPGVQYTGDPYEVFREADAVVLLTEWNLYRGMDMQRAGAIMRNRTFIDLRNVHERDAMESLGFAYHCVGR